jgi:uroporphyrinogen-III synthase
VLLTSGSVARHLADALGESLRPSDEGVVFASIGPTTSAAARAAGLRVDVEAEEHTVEGLLEALRDHYRQGATDPS